jgi:DNA-binding MarR family transcriptional regulator
MKRRTPPTHDVRPVTARAPLPEALTRSTGFLLAVVADAATRDYSVALEQIALAPQHLGILTLIQAEGPLVQARLGDRLQIVKPAIVGLVNDLERMGLVERRAHPTDGRAFEVHLLEAGQRRIEAAAKVSEAATAAFFRPLRRTEQKTLHELLSRLATAHLAQGTHP